MKETVLTEGFEIEGDKSLNKLKDTTRKLRVNEQVEVLEFAPSGKKETNSGLVRMKVRAKSDGAMGWATSQGNRGTLFLKVLS